MADIAPITAKIVASAAGMAGGLADASKKMADFAGRMTKGFASAGLGAGKGFATSLAQGVGLGLGAGLFNAAAAGFGKTAELFTGGADRMLELGKAARQAGADVAGFQAVVEGLGGDVGGAVEGLVKFKEALGKALVEGQDEAFGRLDLDPVGLLGMRDDRALALVAGRLRELGGGVAEARAGVALFGDAFKSLRPLLDDGGARLGRTAERLEKFGAAFGEGDFLQADRWKEALGEVDLLWKGLKTQIGKGLLPILTEVSDRFGSLADRGVTFKGLAGSIIDGAERAARLGATAVAVWSDTEKVKTAWAAATNAVKAAALTLGADLYDALTAAWDRAFAHIKANAAGLSWKALTLPIKPTLLAAEWGAGLAGGAGAWLFGGGGGGLKAAEQKWSDGLREQARRLAAESAGGARSLLESLKGDPLLKWVGDAFAGIRKRADEAAGATGGLKDQFADLYKLWEDGAERAAKALDGPLDKFKEVIGRVRALESLRDAWTVGPLPDDVLPLDPLAARTLAQAFGQLKGAFAPPELRFAGAMLEGSREAYSASVRHQAQVTGRESVEQALKRIMEAQLREEQEQVRVGRDVLAATQALAAKLRVGGI